MFSPSAQVPDSRKRLALKDEALRKKFETELARKKNYVPPQGLGGALRKGKSNAPKGTLAALKPSPPLKVAENLTVGEATQACVAKRTDCFLVADEGGVTGIVTSKDIAYRVIADGLDPRTTLVRQIMTHNPVIIDATSTPTQALEYMLANKCRHLPMRGDDGSIVGILDIAKVFHETLSHAHRRSTASEQLFSAMAGLEAELGTDGANSDMFAWASKLREKTALPDLASVMGRNTQAAMIGPRATVREVAQLMKDKETSAVCIMEEATAAPLASGRRSARLAGIFTSKDVVLRVVAPGLDAPRCSVVRVMTPQPDTAHPTMSIHEAVTKMYDGHYLNMPVIEEDGRLVALIDMFSLAVATQEQIKAANQDEPVPEVSGVTETMLGQFFESTRSVTPPATASEVFSSPGESNFPEQITRSDTQSSDVMSANSTYIEPVSRTDSTTSILYPDAVTRHDALRDDTPSNPNQGRKSETLFRPELRRADVPSIQSIRPESIAHSQSDRPYPNTSHLEPMIRSHSQGPIDSIQSSMSAPVRPENTKSYTEPLPSHSRRSDAAATFEGLHPEHAFRPESRLNEAVPVQGYPDAVARKDSQRSDAGSVKSLPEALIRSESMRSEAVSVTESMSMSVSSLGDASFMSASDRDMRDHLRTAIPSTDTPTFPFKFRAPSKAIYRVQARQNDYNHLREVVTNKLAVDSFFDVDSYSDSNPRPDHNDFKIFYEDDDDDTVGITTDHDVMDAVSFARKMGKERVMITIQGGKGWLAASSAETETEPMPRPSAAAPPPPPPPRVEPEPVPIPIEQPKPVPVLVQDIPPPEYSPRERLENSNVPNATPLKEFTVLTARTLVDVQGVEALKKDRLEDLLSMHTAPNISETKISPSASPFPVADEKGRRAVSAAVDAGYSGDRRTFEEKKKTAENIKALITRLAAIFDNVTLYKRLLDCLDADAQKLLDMFQTLLDVPGLSGRFRRNLLVATQRLSRRAGLYPKCYTLEDIEMVEENPIAAGGFADIYKARFLGQGVCLKVIRVYQSSDVRLFIKRLSAEAILWGQLSHINLLPIYGLYNYNSRLCLVSPWMAYGDITQFLKEHPDENRPLLVLDVGSGIAYLHKNDIVHGDLKGANILVNGCRRACLADFGLSGVSDASTLQWSSNSSAGSKGGSVRWQAPELFDPENEEVILNTKASDVYAFSCVTYEIFTGNIPFFDHFRESTILFRVKAGEQPSRPSASSPAWVSWGLTEATWSLMQSCWSVDVTQRPTINDVVAQHGKTVPAHDDRPLESEDIILSPAHFRDSVSGRAALPSVDDMNDILSRGEVLDSSET